MLMQTSPLLTTAPALYRAFAEQLASIDLAPDENLLLPFAWQQPYRNPHLTVLRGEHRTDYRPGPFLVSFATIELEGDARIGIYTSPTYTAAEPLQAIRQAAAYSLLPAVEQAFTPASAPPAAAMAAACAGLPLYRARGISALQCALG